MALSVFDFPLCFCFEGCVTIGFQQLRFSKQTFSCEKSEMAASHSCFTKLEFLQKIIQKPSNGGSLLERFSKGNGAPKAAYRLMTEEVSK